MELFGIKFMFKVHKGLQPSWVNGLWKKASDVRRQGNNYRAMRSYNEQDFEVRRSRNSGLDKQPKFCYPRLFNKQKKEFKQETDVDIFINLVRKNLMERLKK